MTIFERFSSALVKCSVRHALNRPAPNRIPLSGYDRLQERNYFTVSAGLGDNRRDYTLLEMDDKALHGVHWSWNDQCGRPCSIPLDRINGLRLLFVHYFREQELEFESPAAFLLSNFFKLHVFRVHLDRIRQRLFNKKRLIGPGRLELLRLLSEASLDSTQRVLFSSASVVAMLYPPVRAANHPEYPRFARQYRFLLESLVATEDLADTGNGFVLQGKAFATLAEAETEERRHRDQIRLQKLLAVFTAALVIVGALQIIGGVLDNRLPVTPHQDSGHPTSPGR